MSVLTPNEYNEVQELLFTCGPERIHKAIGRYNEERKHVDGKKATPFLKHVCLEPEKRGLSKVGCHLVNVTAAQNWEWFKGFLSGWLAKYNEFTTTHEV